MPRTVLLADDSVTIQKVVGISFANEDVELITVDNGDDALERARSCRPDVVLADVVMPGLDGYRLCEAIKSDPALRHIPVLLLAGTFEAFDEERARAAGAAGHVTKPFEAQALVDRVKQLLTSAPPPAPAPSFEEEPGIARTVEMPMPEALRVHRETTGSGGSAVPTSGVSGTGEPEAPAVEPGPAEPEPPAPAAREPDFAAAPPTADPGDPPAAGDELAPDPADSAFDFFEEDLTSPGRAGAADASGDSLEAFDFGAPEDATFAGLADPAPGEEADDDGLGELLDEGAAPAGDTHFGIDTDSLLGRPPDADLVASAPPELDARPPAEAAPPAPEPADGPPPGAPEIDLGRTGSAVELGPPAPAGPVDEEAAFGESTGGFGASGELAGAAPAADPLGALGAEELSREAVLDPDPSGSFAISDDDLASGVPEELDAAGSGAADAALPPPHDPFGGPPEPPETGGAGAADDRFADDLFAPDEGSELETVVDPGGETSTPLVDASELDAVEPPPASEGPAAVPPAGGPAFRQEIRDTLEKIAWEAFADVSEQVVRRVVERVEAVAWEVIPQMAETLIREEIRKLKGEPEEDS